MQDPIYRLIARTQDTEEELLSSAQADMLRACGPVLSAGTAPEADLMLIGPKGQTIASYDIWSEAWQAAA